MMNLHDRLKPEIKQALLENDDRFLDYAKKVLNNLKDKFGYDELTIGEIGAIHTYASVSLVQTSTWDMRFGDHLFLSVEEVKKQ